MKCATVHYPELRAFAEKVWDKARWDRKPKGKPKPSTLIAWQAKLSCAGPGHRKAGKAFWREAKREFYRYREAQLEIIALTPYDCGSAGRYAIPCYIVACESGYDWGAVNPSSGAFSVYQFLPSTYEDYCVRCDRSQEDLHRAAGTLYREAGTAPWVCG